MGDLSKLASVSEGTLTYFERGICGVSIDTLKRIADALDITELSTALAPYATADPADVERVIAGYVAAMEAAQEAYWRTPQGGGKDVENGDALLSAAKEARAFAKGLREQGPVAGVDPSEMDRAWDLRSAHKAWDSPEARVRKSR